jgi:hypothetical protein
MIHGVPHPNVPLLTALTHVLLKYSALKKRELH